MSTPFRIRIRFSRSRFLCFSSDLCCLVVLSPFLSRSLSLSLTLSHYRPLFLISSFSLSLCLCLSLSPSLPTPISPQKRYEKVAANKAARQELRQMFSRVSTTTIFVGTALGGCTFVKRRRCGQSGNVCTIAKNEHYNTNNRNLKSGKQLRAKLYAMIIQKILY